MKKGILLLSALIVSSFSLVVHSQEIELTTKEIKYFDSLLDEIGFQGTFTKSNKPKKDYWEIISSKNKELQKYLSKDTKMARNVRTTIERVLVESKPYAESLPYITKKDWDRIDDAELDMKKMLLDDDDKSISIQILLSNDYNASALPNGNIIINSSVYSDFRNEELAFVLAHEYAHYILKHHEVELYNKKKREFKNELIGGIGIAATSAAVLYAASKSRYSNNSGEALSSIITHGDAIINRFNELMYYSYSRKQETEADVAALNFLLYSGIDPYAAISALFNLCKKTPESFMVSDSYSNHPSIASRIKLLYYILNRDKYKE